MRLWGEGTNGGLVSDVRWGIRPLNSAKRASVDWMVQEIVVVVKVSVTGLSKSSFMHCHNPGMVTPLQSS